RQWRVGAQPAILEIVVDRIQSDSVHAPVEPEANCVEKFILDRLIVEIESRLGRKEIVKIILPARSVPLPGRPAEDRKPVVRSGSIRLGIGPYVPVGPGIITA